MRRLARAAAVALALAACGKYGPPVRAGTAPPPKPPPALGVPVSSNTEECQDPNAPPSRTSAPDPGAKPPAAEP